MDRWGLTNGTEGGVESRRGPRRHRKPAYQFSPDCPTCYGARVNGLERRDFRPRSAPDGPGRPPGPGRASGRRVKVGVANVNKRPENASISSR